MKKFLRKLSTLLLTLAFPVLLAFIILFNLRLSVLDGKTVLSVMEKEKTYELLESNYDYFSRGIMEEIGDQPYIQEQFLTQAFQNAFNHEFVKKLATDQIGGLDKLARNKADNVPGYSIVAQKKDLKKELITLSNPANKPIVSMFADEMNKGLPDKIAVPDSALASIRKLQPFFGILYSFYFLLPVLALIIILIPAYLRNFGGSRYGFYRTAGWYLVGFDFFFLIVAFLNKSLLSLVQLLLPEGNVLPFVKDDVLSPLMQNFENRLFKISVTELLVIAAVAGLFLYIGYYRTNSKND